MKTILVEFTSDYRIQGSKFFGFLFPCDAIENAEDRLRELRKKYHDASHHCLAYRIGDEPIAEFSSDDGEPNGTAGLPILQQLRSSELINCACIVVRYFGGTKLGKSGLIDAYGKSAAEAINNARLAEIIPVQWYELKYGYELQKDIDHLLKNYQFEIREQNYTESIRTVIGIELLKHSNFEEALDKMNYLGVRYTIMEKGFIYKSLNEN